MSLGEATSPSFMENVGHCQDQDQACGLVDGSSAFPPVDIMDKSLSDFMNSGLFPLLCLDLEPIVAT